MAEKCPCQTYVTSCCACVSMHCDECHGHSKFVQGRFCSNCGRPLKAELTRLYVPKSEVEKLEKDNEDLRNILTNTINKYRNCKAEVAREIFEEIEEQIDRGLAVITKILNAKGGRANGKTVLLSKYDVFIESKKYIAELEKKYTEE